MKAQETPTEGPYQIDSRSDQRSVAAQAFLSLAFRAEMILWELRHGGLLPSRRYLEAHNGPRT